MLAEAVTAVADLMKFYGQHRLWSREETRKKIIDGKWADKAFVRWQEHLGTTGYDLKELVRTILHKAGTTWSTGGNEVQKELLLLQFLF